MDSTTTPCAFSECTKETFLPHTCAQCNKKFCNKHEAQESHKCPFLNVSKLRTTVCPLCNEVLRVEAGESLDHAVNTHLDTGKCSIVINNNNSNSISSKNIHNNNSKVQQHAPPKQATAAGLLFGFDAKNAAESATKSNFCSLPNCNEYEPVPVVCGHCKRNFCLKHKLPELHSCSKLNQVTKNSTIATSQSQSQQNQQQQKILQGTVVASAKPIQRSINDVLFSVVNTADTASGVRPGRGITQGDILVLVMYDAGSLKRPNLRPVLFSVSPLTPIGRLLDAAVDYYPALAKNLKYTIFSSVALSQNSCNVNNSNNSTSTTSSNNSNYYCKNNNCDGKERKRHLIADENLTVGDAFAEAAATGGVFPPGSMEKFHSSVDNRVILAFCVSVGGIPVPDAEGDSMMMMRRSDTTNMIVSATTGTSGATSDFFAEVPIETRACVLRPFKDAKGVELPILVDKEHVLLLNAGGTTTTSALHAKAGDRGKKDDKCSIQ